MTPFTPELMQTLEDLIPAIAVIIGLSVITYIAFLQNALSSARQTMKDQAAMLAADINLQMDDLEKVQNAKKNEDEANRKYNELMREHEKLKIYIDKLTTTCENLVRTNERLNNEVKLLKDKLARKSQPRDEHGHFSSLPQKNPNIGKYLCNDFVANFEIGRYYKRYQSKTVDPNSLILIGDDLKRHTVDPDDFQLITE